MDALARVFCPAILAEIAGFAMSIENIVRAGDLATLKLMAMLPNFERTVNECPSKHLCQVRRKCFLHRYCKTLFEASSSSKALVLAAYGMVSHVHFAIADSYAHIRPHTLRLLSKMKASSRL